MNKVARRSIWLAAAFFLISCEADWHRFGGQSDGFNVALPSSPLCGPWRKQTSRGQLAGRWCRSEFRPFLGAATGRLGATFEVGWLDLPASLDSPDELALIHEIAILDELEPGVAPDHPPAPPTKSALLSHLDEVWRERRAEWEKGSKHAAERDKPPGPEKVTSSESALGGLKATAYEIASSVEHIGTLEVVFGGHVVRGVRNHRLYVLSMWGHLEPSSERVWRRVLASFHFLPGTN